MAALLLIPVGLWVTDGNESAVGGTESTAPLRQPRNPGGDSQVWRPPEGLSAAQVPGFGLVTALQSFDGGWLLCVVDPASGVTNLWHSSDGRTWVAQTTTGLDGWVADLATRPDGSLVGVGPIGPAAGNPSEAISGVWSSEDGRTWERLARVSMTGGRILHEVTAGDTGYVALADTMGALFEGSVTQASVWVSEDGLTWSEDAPAESGAHVSATGQVGGSAAVFGRTSKGAAWWRRTATGWNATVLGGPQKVLSDLVELDDGSLVALVSTPGLERVEVLKSADGSDWTGLAAPAGLGLGGRLVTDGVRMAAVDGETVVGDVEDHGVVVWLEDSDGSWVPWAGNDGTAFWRGSVGAAFVDGGLIAAATADFRPMLWSVTRSDFVVQPSPEGSWVEYAPTIEGMVESLVQVANGGIATQLADEGALMVDPGGEVRRLPPLPYSGQIRQLVRTGEGGLIASAEGGSTLFRLSGGEWQEVTLPGPGSLRGVSSTHTGLVALTSSGRVTRILSSEDGSEWTEAAVVDRPIEAVLAIVGGFVELPGGGFSPGNSPLVSVDGASWSAQGPPNVTWSLLWMTIFGRTEDGDVVTFDEDLQPVVVPLPSGMTPQTVVLGPGGDVLITGVIRGQAVLVETAPEGIRRYIPAGLSSGIEGLLMLAGTGSDALKGVDVTPDRIRFVEWVPAG